jgi:DNA polymerase-3 subunit delta
VDELVGRSRELSNFELADHLIARNRERALRTLHKILDDGAEPVMLVGLLASNFHRLALAKDLMSRGASEQEVFRLVGPLYGDKRAKFLETARRTDAATLAHRIGRIAQADIAIKTSRSTPRLQLEMLVCELAS